MGHRYLLAIARWALLALLAAGTANATEYNLCNKGKVEVRFATALRSGSSFFGYSWHLDGWYAIPPGKCEDAYLHKSDRDPDEPIYVALAFRDSTGVWGAATFDKPKVDTKLCVARDNFEYRLNGNINLPCKSGYFPFPSALYLEPVAWGCSDKYPGQPVNCWGRYYNFEFEVDNDSRAVAAGPKTSTSAAPPNGKDQSPAEPSIGDAILKELGKAAAEKPTAPFVAACNAWYNDPANGRFRPRDPSAYCSCLGAQYQFLMTPEQVSFYAAAFEQRFRGEIAQPAGHSTDPAWPRLHPAAERCAQ